jgi:uncharacterized protein (TIGR02594 family)
MNNTQLFAEAIKYYKVREIPGKKNNPLIVEWTKSVLQWANDDEVPWCSTFLNAMADAAGLEKSGKANARSWLSVGIEIDNPVVGDVVIFWRESPKSWKGHVGIFVGFSHDGQNILVLGGNQGNEVNISKYPISRLLGFRRLRKREEV